MACSMEADQIQRRYLGREQSLLLVIDEAHPEPNALRANALGASFARRGGDLYPGERAVVPEPYRDWLGVLIGSHFPGAGFTVIDCTFAIVSDEPGALVPIQRIPHFDGVDRDLVAVVHYLSSLPYGGTSLYRHRRTGFETITAERLALWRNGLNRDAAEYGLPAQGYCSGTTAAFERIGGVALRYNRLIVYPANCLHSGDVAGSPLTPDPGEGRLTITSLLKKTS